MRRVAATMNAGGNRPKALGRSSLLLTLAIGCAPQVELASPPPLLTTDWPELRGADQSSLALSERAWAAFGSSELDALITRAQAANSDLAAAAARITQARGRLGVARAADIPRIEAAATGAAASSRSRSGSSVVSSGLSVGVSAAWEIDLFGGLSAGKRSARAGLRASVGERAALSLVIESEVARAFIRYATLNDRLGLIDQSLNDARELARIIGVQLREGAATQVDTGLQDIEIRRLEADRSRLVEARHATINVLAILVGTEPSKFALGPATLKQFRQPFFRVDQPGVVLARRPDVMAAEARILAANGEIARARAAFLPGIRLGASAFTDVTSLSNFSALSLSSALDLVAPIFNRRQLRGDLLTASGQQQEVVANYRKTILVALGEVSDALTSLDQSQQRERLLTKTIQAARRTAQLARRQYVEGAADLQTIFDAQRGLREVEEAHALARQQQLEATISLYRAIGGAPAGVDHKIVYAFD